jgi:hypothetical protein
MCKCKETEKERVKNGVRIFKNKNANIYYKFLGVYDFS